MDLISVIVPVYNVEPYLDVCIRSITQQTYCNVEIILIDDGSTDQCSKICDEWARKDQRIRVIHKTNGGLSDARNTGLRIATGTYIAFVDSDDWIERNFIEYLYQAITIQQADIAACDVRIIEENTSIPNMKFPMPEIENYTPEEAMEQLINARKFRAVVWNKLYRSELLAKEEFEVGRFHEDEFFTYRILDKSKRVVYLGLALYNYRQRQNSIMSSRSNQHLDVLDAYIRRLQLMKSKYGNLYSQDKLTYCITCLNFYCDSIIGKLTDPKKAQIKVRQKRKLISFSFREFRKYSLKNQLYIIMSSSHVIGIFARLRVLKGWQ